MTNGHFDSKDLIQERYQQFQTCHSLLNSLTLHESTTIPSPSTLTLLAGDFNLHSTSELTSITSYPYEDSLLITSLSPEIEDPASATIGLTFPKSGKSPRRSDFVLLLKPSEWKCCGYSYLGRDPIQEDGMGIQCEQGMDGLLFPSDHLGVFTEFILID